MFAHGKAIASINNVSRNKARKRKEIQSKKKKMDETDAAKVYEEFVASFSVAPKPENKQKLTVMDPSVKRNRSITNTNYKRNGKKKPVRNIDLFMQEIKLNAMTRKSEQNILMESRKEKIIEDSDPLSSNVLLGNISGETAETDLLKEMSKYGPVGSVKIRLPKTEEERALSSNSAHINFMRRDDAEACIKAVDGQKIFGQKVTAAFGRRLSKADYPLELDGGEESREENILLDEISDNSKVVVEMLDEGAQKRVIDTVANFVAREGSLFEQNVIELHKAKNSFKFLCEKNTKENIYYRWRVYSLVQGDDWDSWRERPFRMVEGGMVWVPPSLSEVKKSDKLRSIDSLVNAPQTVTRERRRPIRFLSEKKRDEFESLLRAISKDRRTIKMTMGFCIDNSENAIEIVETITESLTIPETEINKKIARLFLVSDILHNSDAKVRNSSAYRSEFQRNLKEIFEGLHKSYSQINGRMTADKMKEEVLTVLRVWQAWSLFPVTLLDSLENSFLAKSNEGVGVFSRFDDNDDIDGVPLDEDIDGFALEA